MTYWISTELGTLDDTVIYLLDEDLVQITQNDNAGRGTRASMIQWQPSKCECAACSGSRDQRTACNYFVKVRSYNPTKTGTFTIRVATEPIPVPGSVPCFRGNMIPRSLTSCNGFNGDSCIYICFPGYVPSGRHVCGADGEWRGRECVALECSKACSSTTPSRLVRVPPMTSATMCVISGTSPWGHMCASRTAASLAEAANPRSAQQVCSSKLTEAF